MTGSGNGYLRRGPNCKTRPYIYIYIYIYMSVCVLNNMFDGVTAGNTGTARHHEAAGNTGAAERK